MLGGSRVQPKQKFMLDALESIRVSFASGRTARESCGTTTSHPAAPEDTCSRRGCRQDSQRPESGRLRKRPQTVPGPAGGDRGGPRAHRGGAGAANGARRFGDGPRRSASFLQSDFC